MDLCGSSSLHTLIPVMIPGIMEIRISLCCQVPEKKSPEQPVDPESARAWNHPMAYSYVNKPASRGIVTGNADSSGNPQRGYMRKRHIQVAGTAVSNMDICPVRIKILTRNRAVVEYPCLRVGENITGRCYRKNSLRIEPPVLKCCYGDSNPSRGRERPA